MTFAPDQLINEQADERGQIGKWIVKVTLSKVVTKLGT